MLDIVDKMDFSRQFCLALGRIWLGESFCSRAVGSNLVGFET